MLGIFNCLKACDRHMESILYIIISPGVLWQKKTTRTGSLLQIQDYNTQYFKNRLSLTTATGREQIGRSLRCRSLWRNCRFECRFFIWTQKEQLLWSATNESKSRPYHFARITLKNCGVMSTVIEHWDWCMSAGLIKPFFCLCIHHLA